MTRILLIHAYLPSMAPVAESFRLLWPEAEALNLLDESLYADVSEDGVLANDIPKRVGSLLRHARDSRADGVLFTGSTFGPAVDQIRGELAIPVLKADEALCARLARSKRALVVCTAKRALPVIRANVAAEAERAGTSPQFDALWVEGAKTALVRGDDKRHDRLIAEAIVRHCLNHDVVALGQFSMSAAKALLPPDVAERVISGPESSVAMMRELLGL